MARAIRQTRRVTSAGKQVVMDCRGPEHKRMRLPMKSPDPSSWPRTPQGRCGRVVHGIVWVPAHLVLESCISVPPTGEFHASAKFLMLVLPHFFPSFFNYTRHSRSFVTSSGGSWKPVVDPGLTGQETGDRNRNCRGNTASQEVSRKCARVNCGYGVVLTVDT